ncbi:hypothetical protein TNCT_435621 [Trichonephila clavata]|uniref:Uncharacterized protein n=1 Tax=Trichonephila clavata TaxID=2740835 RepID=A0A8X6LI29_TRICU|nr:hypothetical protein TNCT_435621 [Trichonephila clavata]
MFRGWGLIALDSVQGRFGWDRGLGAGFGRWDQGLIALDGLTLMGSGVGTGSGLGMFRVCDSWMGRVEIRIRAGLDQGFAAHPRLRVALTFCWLHAIAITLHSRLHAVPRLFRTFTRSTFGCVARGYAVHIATRWFAAHIAHRKSSIYPCTCAGYWRIPLNNIYGGDSASRRYACRCAHRCILALPSCVYKQALYKTTAFGAGRVYSLCRDLKHVLCNCVAARTFMC